MKPAMKMMLLDPKKHDDHEKKRDYFRGDYDLPEMNYGEVENRFRDRRGREHYDNGRYAPMRNAYDDGPDMESYPYYPSMPPVYRGRNNGNNYDNKRERREPMNRIGFSLDGEMERIPDSRYAAYSEHPRVDEMKYREGEMQQGYGDSQTGMPLSREMAREWTSQMENEDGTTGPHWNMSQTDTVMAQKGIECDPTEFFVTMNMMYSDYCKVFRKFGVVDKIDFYACMAKAFLDDKDAHPDKLARYYEYVVR